MRKLAVNSFNSLYSTLFNFSILLILLLGFPFSSIAESIGCDDDYVQLDNNALVINVATTGVDDTTNIQCALDVAASDGYPIVRLGAGTYFISGLIVENFKGTLEGKSKTSTIVEVPYRTVDCDAAMEDIGLTSAVIKFVKGEPRIRYMTIRVNRPCSGFQPIQSILHFTGESSQADNCDNDVIFGAVDRVILEATDISTSRSWVGSGILVSAEGNQLGGCKDTLLGTFKLNRSTISNIANSLKTTMKAGAQVDINFNEFFSNTSPTSSLESNKAIWLPDTNQNTTITANKFNGVARTGDTWGYHYWGVYLDTFSMDAPAVTRLVIHNNQFDLTSTPDASARAISLDQSGRIANVSSIVTGNTFTLSGSRSFGIIAYSVSNTHVSANRFTGEGHTAISVTGTSTVTGWTVTANKGLATFNSMSEADISFSSSTSRCIVGPGQGAEVSDQGTDNTVLPQ